MYKKLETYTGDPWDKQPGENAEQYRAFCTYRDAEPKIGTEKVAEKYGKSKGWAEQLCTARRWVDRRELWAEYQGKLTTEELKRGIPAMRKSHTDIATAMLIKAAKALKAIPTEEMTMQDVARAVDVATKLERLSRGEATERTESNTAITGKVTVDSNPYEELTTEELRALAQAVKDDKRLKQS
ncbi:MAG: hypothetical protein LBS21_06900 [Clostridiales bacterium]|jgi:hypothetical protein|nr:hypothetical protein [Clostridiales bacterium]